MSLKILILDYSVDRSETSDIKRWLPVDANVSSLFIDTEDNYNIHDIIKREPSFEVGKLFFNFFLSKNSM